MTQSKKLKIVFSTLTLLSVVSTSFLLSQSSLDGSLVDMTDFHYPTFLVTYDTAIYNVFLKLLEMVIQ